MPTPGPPRGGGTPRGVWVALGAFVVLVIGGGITAGFLVGGGGDSTPSAETSPAAPTDPTTPESTATWTPAPTSEPTDEPTQAPTAADVPEIVNGRVSGDGFSLPVSGDYQIGAWGERDDGEITNGTSEVSIYIWDGGDPRARCETEITVLAIWVPGTTAALPDRQVGGKDAPGNELRGDDGDYYEQRCVLHNDRIYNISLSTTMDASVAASAEFAALLDGWIWE